MQDEGVARAADDEVPALLRDGGQSTKARALWEEELLLVGRTRRLTADQIARLLAALERSQGATTRRLIEARDALDPASRAAFGWTLSRHVDEFFEPWKVRSLGVLYNDDTVAGLIESLEASEGDASGPASLMALAQIGSKKAMAYLCNLAAGPRSELRKVARTELQALAKHEGLTREELQDGHIEDLEVTADGTFDFGEGPRAIHFDTALTPSLSEGGDKPAGWDAFEQEVAGVAAREAGRLETAMISGRIWKIPAFERTLHAHPLVRWGVRGLVWRFGTTTCRPDADGWVDVDGKKVKPKRDLRLVHPADLSEAEITAWRKHLADRGIAQMVSQMHREVFGPDEARPLMKRLQGSRLSVGALLGLLDQGFAKGDSPRHGEWSEFIVQDEGVRSYVRMDERIIPADIRLDETRRIEAWVEYKNPSVIRLSETLRALSGLLPPAPKEEAPPPLEAPSSAWVPPTDEISAEDQQEAIAGLVRWMSLEAVGLAKEADWSATHAWLESGNLVAAEYLEALAAGGVAPEERYQTMLQAKSGASAAAAWPDELRAGWGGLLTDLAAVLSTETGAALARTERFLTKAFR